MSAPLSVDGRGLLNGAAAGVLVGLLTIITFEVLDEWFGIDRQSNLVFPFYLVLLGGLAYGGLVAARRGADTPLTHGALAALVAYGCLALITTVVRVLSGNTVDWVALVFHALMASSAGVIGGMLASRRPRTAPAGPPEDVESPG